MQNTTIQELKLHRTIKAKKIPMGKKDSQGGKSDTIIQSQSVGFEHQTNVPAYVRRQSF